jgi:hypothetical protein
MQEEAKQLARDMHVLHKHPRKPAQNSQGNREEAATKRVRAKHAQERLMKQVVLCMLGMSVICMHCVCMYVCMYVQNALEQS